MRAALTLVLCAIPAAALTLALGGAPAAAQVPPPPAGVEVTFAETLSRGQVWFPLGRVTRDERPGETVEGAVARTVWRYPANPAPPLDLLRGVEAVLAAADYAPVYDCAAPACGGFDFRYAIALVPAPAMEVDLGDFHFAALRSADGTRWASLIASRAGVDGYVQITMLAPPGTQPPVIAGPPVEDGAAPTPPAAVPDTVPDAVGDVMPDAVPDAVPDALGEALLRTGRAVLPGIDFRSGSAEFAPGSEAGVDALAALLRAQPGLRLYVVGHTDATGALSANTTLSLERAQAVVAAVEADVPEARGTLEAAGAGSLAPVASNATAEGRAMNRRVEIVLRP